MTWHEDIRPISHGKKAQDARKECWDGTGLNSNIGFWECHTQGGNQLFKYIPDKHQIFHVPSQGCATADKVHFFVKNLLIFYFQATKKVVLKYCNDDDENQKWWWDEQNETVLERVNSNMRAIVEPPELDYLS